MGSVSGDCWIDCCVDEGERLLLGGWRNVGSAVLVELLCRRKCGGGVV